MDRLKGILSLASSRKIFLTILVVLLALVNRKFNIGLTESEIQVVSAAIIAAIVGIAMEDAARARKLIIVAIFPFALGGCFETHARDEVTISQVQKTIENREGDFARLMRAAKTDRDAAVAYKAYAEAVARAAIANGVTMTATAPIPEITSPAYIGGINAIQASEIDRLKQWLEYETVKGVAP